MAGGRARCRVALSRTVTDGRCLGTAPSPPHPSPSLPLPSHPGVAFSHEPRVGVAGAELAPWKFRIPLTDFQCGTWGSKRSQLWPPTHGAVSRTWLPTADPWFASVTPRTAPRWRGASARRKPRVWWDCERCGGPCAASAGMLDLCRRRIATMTSSRASARADSSTRPWVHVVSAVRSS